jgi:hypothetical protein
MMDDLVFLLQTGSAFFTFGCEIYYTFGTRLYSKFLGIVYSNMDKWI